MSSDETITIEVSTAKDAKDRRRHYVAALSVLQHELLSALDERKMTKVDVAKKLGKHKSFITRKFNGIGGAKFVTLCAMAWAMDKMLQVTLVDKGETVEVIPAGCNHTPNTSALARVKTGSSGAARFQVS